METEHSPHQGTPRDLHVFCTLSWTFSLPLHLSPNSTAPPGPAPRDPRFMSIFILILLIIIIIFLNTILFPFFGTFFFFFPPLFCFTFSFFKYTTNKSLSVLGMRGVFKGCGGFWKVGLKPGRGGGKSQVLLSSPAQFIVRLVISEFPPLPGSVKGGERGQIHFPSYKLILFSCLWGSGGEGTLGDIISDDERIPKNNIVKNQREKGNKNVNGSG